MEMHARGQGGDGEAGQAAQWQGSGCATTCKLDTPRESALGPQELKPGLWDSRGRVGGGREAVAQRWLIRAGARQGPARHCRATPPQSSKC